MRSVAAILLVVFSALFAGCNSSPGGAAFQLTDITGAEFARSFQLTDHNGKVRTLADFKGKVVVVFFGYTYCPDACPTTMGELAMVMKELGKDADRLQVLFITVDPERDTPAVLSRYVPAFNPAFIGLYGDAEATARTAKEFRVLYQKQPMPGGAYSVDHSAGSFIFDPDGKVRLFAQYGQGAQTFLHDIRLLLKQAK
jgi:protein SCO1